MMAGKHALVTGAAGFIGSHLVEMLVREGVQVRAFVRYNSGRRTGTLDLLPADVRQNLELYYGDLRDRFPAEFPALIVLTGVIFLRPDRHKKHGHDEKRERREHSDPGTQRVEYACRGKDPAA